MKEILAILFLLFLLGIIVMYCTDNASKYKHTYIVINNGDTLLVKKGLIMDIKHKK